MGKGDDPVAGARLILFCCAALAWAAAAWATPLDAGRLALHLQRACVLEAVYLLDDGHSTQEALADAALSACSGDSRHLNAAFLRTVPRADRPAWRKALVGDLAAVALESAYYARTDKLHQSKATAPKRFNGEDAEMEPRPVTEAVGGDAACGMSSVALAPDGGHALLWSGFSSASTNGLIALGEAVVVDLDCELAREPASPACAATRLDSGPTPEPLGWSKDSRTTFVLYRNGGGPGFGDSNAGPSRLQAFSIDPGQAGGVHLDGTASVSYPPISNIWMGGPFAAKSLEEVRQELAAALRRISAARPFTGQLVGMALEDDGPLALFTSVVDLSTSVLVRGERVEPIHLPGLPELQGPMLSPAAGGATVLTALGVLEPVIPGARPPPASASLYSNPFSWSDGDLAGVYGGRWVRMAADDETSRKLVRAVSEILDQTPQSGIVSLSVSRSGRAVLILAVDDRHNVAHFIDVAAKRSTHYACLPPPEPPLPGIVVLKVEHPEPMQETVVSLGTATHPLFGTLMTSTTGQRRKLAVVIHGGPFDSTPLLAVGSTANNYLALGFDVLAVEYSGALGAGPETSGRLRRLGGAALEQDAALVRAYVAASPYRFHVLHVESFGASLALADPRRDAGIYQAMVMLVPFGRWRPPEEWTMQSPGRPVQPFNQTRFETVAYGPRGGPHDVRTWITKRGRTWTPTLPTFVYYAERDLRSVPSDLPGAGSDQLHVVVIKGAMHELIGQEPSVWTSIKANLEALDPQR